MAGFRVAGLRNAIGVRCPAGFTIARYVVASTASELDIDVHVWVIDLS